MSKKKKDHESTYYTQNVRYVINELQSNQNSKWKHNEVCLGFDCFVMLPLFYISKLVSWFGRMNPKYEGKLQTQFIQLFF